MAGIYSPIRELYHDQCPCGALILKRAYSDDYPDPAGIWAGAEADGISQVNAIIFRHHTASLFLTKDTSPPCPGTIQTRTVGDSSAGPSTLPTFCRGLVNRDMTLPAADQTRNNVTG